MDTILLTGLFAAFFTTFAFAPQSIKTIRTRNTEGISVVMYIMFLTGVISWIAYGIMRSDFAVLIANIVTLFLAAPVLVITLINRRKKRHCCKVSDEAAFCLIQRPYISKTLLTRRISPRGSP
ncbi:hypothetical protein I2I55_004147 [Salmonella enterica]|nr:hypothetical protein [Salmonella enterica]EBA0998247.1 hypothetical protein [Salmonella enterica]EGQ0621955.1 hypothetical protein [Salmonella enterica]EGQ0640968.1 hypothetical protein [Salmonella enterica]EGT6046426.1 hypothetical protein [Salmonella enterica]